MDRTGLTFFNARYYDSDTGRFITPDPTNAIEVKMLLGVVDARIRQVDGYRKAAGFAGDILAGLTPSVAEGPVQFTVSGFSTWVDENYGWSIPFFSGN